MNAGASVLSFSFRIRVNRAPTATILEESNEIVLPSGGEEFSVRLRANQGRAIRDSQQLSLVGTGYATVDDAEVAGSQYQNALMVALAASGVGVDFGHRAPKGFVTQDTLELARQNAGTRVLNDVHGLSVYGTNPPPVFASISANGARGANRDAFFQKFEKVIEAPPNLSEQELLAFTLFNASFFRQTADSRFILLMMAVEALIEPKVRPKKSVALVKQLIEQVRSSGLDDGERNSIMSSLGWLKKESIGSSGRRLASVRLGSEKKYKDLSPSDFFTKCYNMRSALVHGNRPYPEFSDVGTSAATLEVFVSDLLTAPYLDK